jgi:hypothetical protein
VYVHAFYIWLAMHAAYDMRAGGQASSCSYAVLLLRRTLHKNTLILFSALVSHRPVVRVCARF